MNDLTIPIIRIFLVDDYQTVLWGFTKLIQGEYPHLQLVGTASSCNATLTGVSQKHPDVILLDYELGDESSLSILPQLVAQVGHHILILTEHPCSSEIASQVVALGACGTLNKDAPADVLLQAIECVHRESRWPL